MHDENWLSGPPDGVQLENVYSTLGQLPDFRRDGIQMIDMSQFQLWFLTGSQHLYGPETLKKVQEHSTEIANALGA